MALRDPTPEEVSELIDEGVILNEAGADLLTRWLAKTFAANPVEAKAFLERRGFDVLVTDRVGKLQFAIRNRDISELVGEKQNPWKVLDPEGFDFGDMVDIAFDIFIAGPIIATSAVGGALAGAPGGPVGVALGGAAGAGGSSAAVESGRQLIGGALGVNRQPDIGAIGRAGALGAILPGVFQRVARFPQALLKLGKFATEKLANLGRNLSGRVAGTAEEAITTAAQSGARTNRIIAETARKPIELLDRIRGTINRLRDPNNRFPESREISQLLEKSRKMPLRGLFKILEQRNVQPIGNQRMGVTSARRIAQQIAHRLGFPSVAEASRARITAQQAQEIKQILQSQIDFSGRPGEKFLNRVLKEAQGNLRNRIVSSLPSSEARARYRTLNGFASFTDTGGKFHAGKGVVGKMEALNGLDKKIGEHLKTGTSEKFLGAVTGEGRTQERRLVEQFDRLFGTDFIEEGLTTRLAAPFSRDAPKLTATGEFIGPGIGAAIGGAAGGIAGGAEGAAIGAPVGFGVGFVAGAPKGMLRAARSITSAERAVRGGIRRGGQVMRRVEPLLDAVARGGGGALASAGAREHEFPPIRVEGTAEPQIDAMKRIADEINAIPGLSDAQKVEEFQKRFKESGISEGAGQ